jgi:hypothetical protein
MMMMWSPTIKRQRDSSHDVVGHDYLLHLTMITYKNICSLPCLSLTVKRFKR